MTIDGSAIGAVKYLRVLIEERLATNEDYRALVALDEVIAHLQPLQQAAGRSKSALQHDRETRSLTSGIIEEIESLRERSSKLRRGYAA